MSAPVVRIHNRIEPLESDWERLARRVRASPFLWPGWTRACWNVLDAGELRILAAYERGRLCGVLPMRRFRGLLASTTISESTVFGFLATSETVVEWLSRALISQKARHTDLSLLTARDADILLGCISAEAPRYRVVKESIQAAPYVTTDGTTFETYKGRLRRKFRSEISRRRRRLEEQGRLALDVYDGTEGLDGLLEEGFGVEGSGWKGAYGTSINLHPGLRGFYTEIARWAAERGWLRLAFLRLDGRALAFDYCLEYDGVHYLLKTGYDPAYSRFSPGMIIRYLMLERAFSEEIDTYDFCGPDMDWKREWTDATQERIFVHTFAPTVLGSIDRAVFTHVSPAVEGAKRSALGDVLRRGRGLTRRRLGG